MTKPKRQRRNIYFGRVDWGNTRLKVSVLHNGIRVQVIDVPAFPTTPGSLIEVEASLVLYPDEPK